MNTNARNWRVLVGGVAAGSAALIGFAGASASAEPVPPAPPAPAPATVTQTVTVTAAPLTPAAATATPTPAATAAAPTTAAAAAAAASTTPAAPAEPALQPASSGTITEFFKDKNVALEPQKSAGFTALQIVLPVPPGWSVVPDPNVPDAFIVIADRKGGDGLYTSNAQLQVYKLVGDFDPREAISHGFIDSQKLRGWQSTSASLAEFGGFPSSVITGTYRDNDMILNTTRRYVIAQAGSDQYLLSMSVTTAANQAVVTATATDAILNGFRVVDPAAVPAAAPAAPAPAAAPDAPAPAAAPEAPVPAAVPAPPAPAAPAPAAAAPAPAAPAPAAPAPAPAVAPAAPAVPPVSAVVPPPIVDPAAAVVATVPVP